ncbi:MAG: DUF4249 domain-containing protein [Saprospiraceae bacterium]
MKMIQKIIAYTFLLLLISSCTKEFTFDSEETKSKIVVNSLVKNTKEMEVAVTKSFSVSGDAELEELENAQVAIFKNDSFVENLVYTKTTEDAIGKFSSTFIPETNSDYRIEVSHPDLETVQANATLPNGVEISDASVKFVGGNSFNFSFTLDDPAEVNYYFIKMFFRSYILDSITQEKKYLYSERIEIPVAAVPDGQRYLDNGFIFKDETFGDDKATIAGIAKYTRIPASIGGGNFPSLGGPAEEAMTDSSTLFIHLETLSENAFKYYKSNATYLNLLTVDIFGEATSLFSNVENGYGIFAGVYVSEVGVEVEE